MGILICGLNGVGKSTVGRLLAQRLAYRFIDNEDLFFPKEDPEYVYSHPRSKKEVIQLLEESIFLDRRFVFAAVRGDYGDKLLSLLDYAVLIDVPKSVRLQRVHDRSFAKFGERMLSGGDLYEREDAFFSLVSSRPENYVSSWLECVNCPVVRIDGTRPAEENVKFLISVIRDL
ncbi:MAG: AAA family ATPase [Oscillospiraceae bacterium]|nr:AAA family ATPase [Oscillospiraceae bacterium]